MRGPTSANLFHLLKLEIPIASKFAVQDGIKKSSDQSFLILLSV